MDLNVQNILRIFQNKQPISSQTKGMCGLCYPICTPKTPSPPGLISKSWESPLPMLFWGTSLEQPNKMHK
jgi:hypothetical protein